MRLAVLQHVPFEGPAAIADWAKERGVSVRIVRLDLGEAFPALSEFDILAIMGGPMSVNDSGLHPWLNPEISFVREAIAAGKVVLGVCLGAQTIAKALGASVYSGAQKEIGWLPVYRREASSPVFNGVPASFTAFHWHGETFDLPPAAVCLASTPATPHQAFAVGEKVLGLQFHVEATPQSVTDLLANASDEIGTGPYEQKPDTILAGAERCEALRPILYGMLDNLTGHPPKANIRLTWRV